jgi:Fe-S oxidoreductase
MTNNKFKITDWLPITKKESVLRGWDELDVILFSGDAYVDHPSFGSAVIGRIIESRGLRIAIVPQPNWRDDLRDFKKFGIPKLFFAVTSGCMDSMVNHYTAGRRIRSDDAYTPGGKGGFRPDYAVSVYSGILKELFPDVPVVAGGVEASLRRFTHYDYWSDSLKPSVIADGSIDLLIYGMGERPILEILELMKKGVPFSSLKTIAQTGILISDKEKLSLNKNWTDLELHSHEACLADKKNSQRIMS